MIRMIKISNVSMKTKAWEATTIDGVSYPSSWDSKLLEPKKCGKHLSFYRKSTAPITDRDHTVLPFEPIVTLACAHHCWDYINFITFLIQIPGLGGRGEATGECPLEARFWISLLLPLNDFPTPQPPHLRNDVPSYWHRKTPQDP